MGFLFENEKKKLPNVSPADAVTYATHAVLSNRKRENIADVVQAAYKTTAATHTATPLSPPHQIISRARVLDDPACTYVYTYCVPVIGP